MSIENIEKLYAMAHTNPALVAGLPTDGDAAAYAAAAVLLGAAHGCAFSEQEAAGWIAAKAAATRNGELDDLQLEAVAGGKAGPGIPSSQHQRSPLFPRVLTVPGGVIADLPKV